MCPRAGCAASAPEKPVTVGAPGRINVMTDDADSDPELVARSLTGDRAALTALLVRHQPYVYNLAFRMVMTRADAEDVTQEILLKLMTRLSSFDPKKGAFRTWVYRVVANHVLDMRARGYERTVPPLSRYYAFVDDVPDHAPEPSPEAQQIAADLAIGCVMGVLLCLERRERLAFLLAVAFGVSDVDGGAILDISRDAFRKQVSRARARLEPVIEARCGLVAPAAPCRCAHKVDGLVRLGAYGGGRPLSFVDPSAPQLREAVEMAITRFDREVYPAYARLVREQPFYPAPDVTAWLQRLVAQGTLDEIFRVG
jgi:RNA polymerase sigma factor (sigma-70 family)